MADIADIIKRRSTPGILIFNENADLLFRNPEASELIAANPSLDEDIRSLCDRVMTSVKNAPEGMGFQINTVCRGDSRPRCAMRAFVIGERAGVQEHIIVLLEKVAEKRSVDIQGAKAKFKLTKRELEVLVTLHEGLTNKAISERLFISPQTVKDHIRNIMRKVGVRSRGALIAAVQ